MDPAAAGQHEQMIDNDKEHVPMIINSHEIPLEPHRVSAEQAKRKKIAPC